MRWYILPLLKDLPFSFAAEAGHLFDFLGFYLISLVLHVLKKLLGGQHLLS